MYRRRLIVIPACLALAACATPGNLATPGSLTIPLTGELQAIADVEGPYGAVSYGKHAVAIRVWPDSLDDGLAEITVIVTNGSWNTIEFRMDDVALIANNAEWPMLGKSSMLSRIDAAPADSTSNVTGDIEPLSERESSREVAVGQGGMAGARRGSDAGSIAVDPALAAAARRASAGRRPAARQMDGPGVDAQREIISDWYLGTIAIYAGDTGTGGISFPLPDSDTEFELRISIGDEHYVFPLSYLTGE